MGTLRAHRAQKEPGEAAMTARPDNEQIRVLGRVKKTVDGRTMLDIHIGLDSRLTGGVHSHRRRFLSHLSERAVDSAAERR